MAKKNENGNVAEQQAPQSTSVPTQATRIPRSLAIALNGIETLDDIARICTATVTDVLEGVVQRGDANAVFGGCARSMEAYRLKMRHGSQHGMRLFGANGTEAIVGHDPRAAALAKLTEDERKALGLS